MGFAGAGEDDGGRRVEPDDIAEVFEEGAVFGAANDTAAGGDDAAGGGGIGEFLEQGGFHIAEGGFAVGGEDFRDGFAGALFDDLIHIDERVAEALLEGTADGGFAAAHKADDDDIFRQDGCWVHGRKLAGPAERTNRKKYGVASGGEDWHNHRRVRDPNRSSRR